MQHVVTWLLVICFACTVHLAPCCFVLCCFLLRIVIIIVVIGGQRRQAYASLAACHCMLFYVRCMLIDTWQINSLSLSLSLSIPMFWGKVFTGVYVDFARHFFHAEIPRWRTYTGSVSWAYLYLTLRLGAGFRSWCFDVTYAKNFHKNARVTMVRKCRKWRIDMSQKLQA